MPPATRQPPRQLACFTGPAYRNSCWVLSPYVQACPEDGGEAPKEALQKVVRQFGSDGDQELPGRLGMGAVGGGHTHWWQADMLVGGMWVLHGHSHAGGAGPPLLRPTRMPPVLRTAPQARSPLTSWRSRCTAAAATPTPRGGTATARALATAWPLPRMTSRVGLPGGAMGHRDGGLAVHRPCLAAAAVRLSTAERCAAGAHTGWRIMLIN